MQPDQTNQSSDQPSNPTPAPVVSPETAATTATPTPQVAPEVTSIPAEVPKSTPTVTLSDPVDTSISASVESPAPEQPVHWQATEYIHHEKNIAWFVIFAIVVLGFMLIAILLIKSITFAILIPVMAAALLVYTHRPPRILDYTLSSKGLYINDKLYPLVEYKSFGIIQDAEEYSVMLIPVKRFRPGVSVYFPENAGEAIVDMLGARLPMQELHLDIIDRLIRKLRI